MNEESLKRVAALLKELCVITNTHVCDALLVLQNEMFSEEECGQLYEELGMIEPE